MLTSAQEVQCIGPQGSEQYVFEGYVDKVGLMVLVDHRELLLIIRQLIVPGTTITSGMLTLR